MDNDNVLQRLGKILPITHPSISRELFCLDRQRISEDGGNFLMKPILPEKLLTLVLKMLDR